MSLNRKSLVVFLCLLSDAEGKPLYTYQELSVLLESSNRTETHLVPLFHLTEMIKNVIV